MDRFTPLRRAAVLVALEGLALAVGGLALLGHALLGSPDDRTGTMLVGGIALVVGAALLAVARGLGAAAGWAWAPTVLTQVFLAITAVGALQSGAWLLALVLGVLLVSVLYQLVLPEARASYRR